MKKKYNTEEEAIDNVFTFANNKIITVMNEKHEVIAYRKMCISPGYVTPSIEFVHYVGEDAYNHDTPQVKNLPNQLCMEAIKQMWGLFIEFQHDVDKLIACPVTVIEVDEKGMYHTK